LCSNNQLEALPPNLPDSLTQLLCSNNQLAALPPNLPNSLTHLLCSNNQLELLPNLPNSLTHLLCSNNQLQALPPNLPDSLEYLYCYNNELTALPNLPNNLQILKLSVYQVVLLNIDNIPISTFIEIVDENEYPTEITSESEQRYETINNRINVFIAQLGDDLILNCPRYKEITRNSRILKTTARILFPSLPENVPNVLKSFLGGKKSKRKSKRKSNKKKRTTRKRK
jgi:Leucine-rich repeat (LRR) protein